MKPQDARANLPLLLMLTLDRMLRDQEGRLTPTLFAVLGYIRSIVAEICARIKNSNDPNDWTIEDLLPDFEGSVEDLRDEVLDILAECFLFGEITYRDASHSMPMVRTEGQRRRVLSDIRDRLDDKRELVFARWLEAVPVGHREKAMRARGWIDEVED